MAFFEFLIAGSEGMIQEAFTNNGGIFRFEVV